MNQQIKEANQNHSTAVVPKKITKPSPREL